MSNPTAEKLFPTTGYAVATRAGNDDRHWTLTPHVRSRRKDLVMAFPYILKDPSYRIVRVRIVRWKGERIVQKCRECGTQNIWHR